MTMSEFSLEAYQELLLAFRAAEYSFSRFEEIDQRLAEQRPFVILRHDIDISLRAALEVARVEYNQGIQASYFVPLNSPFYNTLSSPNANLLCQIHEMGHEIALHVDLRPYYGDCARALTEVAILARFYPYINSELVSLHSPIALNKELVEPFPPLNNVYSHFLHNQVAYISDSTGRWRYGHPLDSPAFYNRQPLQLLTHPIWWTQEGESPRKKLEYWLQGDYQHNLAIAKEYLPKLFRTTEI